MNRERVKIAQDVAAALAHELRAPVFAIGSAARLLRYRGTVRNDGAPFAPDTLARAFEPLVRTKPGHAGIGLAIAQRIVNEHAGAIFLESGAGAGTSLTFTLPAGHG